MNFLIILPGFRGEIGCHCVSGNIEFIEEFRKQKMTPFTYWVLSKNKLYSLI